MLRHRVAVLVTGVCAALLAPSGLAGAVSPSYAGGHRSVATGEASPPLVEGYRTIPGFIPRSTEPGNRPYESTKVIPEPGRTASASTLGHPAAAQLDRGVVGGGPAHPVRLAMASFLYLDSYRNTGTASYLTAAVTAAEALLADSVVVGEARFFPYRFDHNVVGDSAYRLTAPWYSGMAQGQALSAFVRLYQVTGEERWRTAADEVFASLRVGPNRDTPWVSWVDGSGNLWLEEYPNPIPARSEKVLNGHFYAAYGLYDYWQVTGDAAALDLFNGAIATLERTVLTQFRRPGRASVYSLEHRYPTATYHTLHEEGMVTLYRLTGLPVFATAAHRYREDFPLRTTSGRVRLTPKVTRLYKVHDKTLAITATTTVTLSAERTVAGYRRERTANGWIMIRLRRAAPFHGWWAREVPGQATFLGPTQVHSYTPYPLPVAVPPGTYTGYTYAPSGRRSAARVVSLTQPTRWTVTHTAIVDGRTCLLVRSGPFARHWVPLTARMTLG